MTVGEWLALQQEDPRSGGMLLLAAVRDAGERVRLPSADRDDVIAEAAHRALADDRAALRRASASTLLGAWARGCVRNVSFEVFRARKEKEKEKEKEKDKRGIEDAADQAPSPYDVAAQRDETTYWRRGVMRAARALPLPYGHVLVWRLMEGLSWQQVRDRLNVHRPGRLPPISGRQARRLATKSEGMLKDWLRRVGPRVVHRQKYIARKNPWIGATLPPLPSQIL